jgi:flagella basal body P-ring formation protein FlgA
MELANVSADMNTTHTTCTGRARWGALLVLAPMLASAGEWQGADTIQAAAVEAATSALGDAPGSVTAAAEPLDPRLRMAECDQPISASVASPSQDTSRVTAEVRCDGSRPWRLFVPVRVTVRRGLVVAAVPLARGKVLAAGDVILAERDAGALPGGYLTTTDAAVGRVLRRNLPAGAVLSPALLESPVLVKRGQPVTLEAKAGAITVQMTGVAQADGALGQTIPVRNDSSRKVLQAVVRNEKSVQIILP